MHRLDIDGQWHSIKPKRRRNATNHTACVNGINIQIQPAKHGFWCLAPQARHLKELLKC